MLETSGAGDTITRPLYENDGVWDGVETRRTCADNAPLRLSALCFPPCATPLRSTRRPEGRAPNCAPAVRSRQPASQLPARRYPGRRNPSGVEERPVCLHTHRTRCDSYAAQNAPSSCLLRRFFGGEGFLFPPGLALEQAKPADKFQRMDRFFENAQRIFDVAVSAADSERQDFALLIRADGGLHFVMESAFSLEAAAIHGGAESAYRITRSCNGVRVHGRSMGRDCVLEERSAARELLRDQPLYRITPPLLNSSAVS